MSPVWYITAAILLAGCSTGSNSGNLKDAKDLTKARDCSAKPGDAVRGGLAPASKINMVNDGGWCWANIWTTMGSSSAKMGVPMTVTKQPEHGTVAVKVFDDTTRLAYKPQEGYAGQDAFITVSDMYNIERIWQVTVVK